MVNEDSPCHPLNEYERSKYEAEMIALEWSKKTGITVTVLRPTIVFGEGVRDPSNSMLAWLRAIQTGRFVFFDHQAVANYVYVGDVARACRLAIESTASGIFIASDPCQLTDFVNAAADLLGVPPPRLFVPARLAAIAAFFIQTIWRGSPLTSSRVRALSNRTCYTSTRIQNELGWSPINGWHEGLRRTVSWYREQGQL
jgi:nucleoside-diphosphate-sugar epimerase